MKKNANEIFMLQYRIKRYQAMGNGTMCQALNGKLQNRKVFRPLLLSVAYDVFSKRRQS